MKVIVTVTPKEFDGTVAMNVGFVMDEIQPYTRFGLFKGTIDDDKVVMLRSVAGVRAVEAIGQKFVQED